MPKMYEALAEAFLAEGVDTQFVLMGDGNMHWSTAFAKLPGVHTVHVRHEHATVAAATAYNIATDKIAVASVTCGPGLTQVMTALPAAVRASLPMTPLPPLQENGIRHLPRAALGKRYIRLARRRKGASSFSCGTRFRSWHLRSWHFRGVASRPFGR